MRRRRTAKRGWIGSLVGVLVASVSFPAAGEGAAVGDPELPWLDNAYYKVHLELRPRIALADQDGLKASQAYTMRTRVGLEARPYHGFSALAELLNVWSLDEDSYFDVASTPNGHTPIADPAQTELNRAWLAFSRPAWWDVLAKGGRQRIVLDDQRFVSNAGWRQGEQTFEAARGQTSLGVDGLTLEYAYLWKIRRVLGDQGPRALGTRDWNSRSHLVHVHYADVDLLDALDTHLEISAFAYLIDLEQSAPNLSSNSYGFRVTGETELGESWVLGYAGSYAYQTDAADNPTDYDAHYAWVSADLGPRELGSLGVGYELLGSDHGRAVFATPLTTVHRFNGYANVFANNGGPGGLQDLFVGLEPALPWELRGKLVFHEFWSDQGGHHLGREIDGVLARPINAYLTALVEAAYFDGTARGPADTYRLDFQLTFSY